MLYGNYQFSCTLDHDAELPVYKGAIFRDGLGPPLKQTVCAISQQSCKSCLLKERCLFFQVYETSHGDQTGKHGQHKPRPCVIVPPLDSATRFLAGSSFHFNLLLFGDTNSSLPYFIYAFREMGKNGIGKMKGGQRVGFTLDRVTENGALLYEGGHDRIARQVACPLELNKNSNGNGEIKRVNIEFETPLSVTFENKLQDTLPFHVLTRAMLRRVASLLDVYGAGEPDLDYKGLVKRSKDVRMVESRLSWFEWERYSFRQKRSMPMKGVTGSVTYEGGVDEFFPLLDFCSRVHLGKNTTFGLGKFGFSEHKIV